MPRNALRTDCIEERILNSSGGVNTILLDERYTPYTQQNARIENLCGSFTEYVHTSSEINKIASRNGAQKELFHLNGNIVIKQGKTAFMAARGMSCIRKLARCLRISNPENVIHMAVLTSRMGRRVQVTSAGLLEAILATHHEQIRIKGRLYEQTNTVRFTVTSFAKPPFNLPKNLIPDNNDWTVTGRGMIIIRLVWRRLEWTDETERTYLRMCDAATEWLHTCS